MTTLTDPIHIEYLHEFLLQRAHGISFCILMDRGDGDFKFYDRLDQPCWGELRTYNKKLDGYSKPGDLHHPFPKVGNPIGLSAINYAGHNEFFRWLMSDQSPWASAVAGSQLTISGHTYPRGVVFTNTKVDPTVLVSALLLSKNMKHVDQWDKLVNAGVDPRVAFLLVYQCPNFSTKSHFMDTYSFAARIDPWRWWNGVPHNLTPGQKTFYDRGNYNRPAIQNVFKGSFYVPEFIRKDYPSSFTLALAVKDVAPKLTDFFSNAKEDPTNVLQYDGPSGETDGDYDDDEDNMECPF